MSLESCITALVVILKVVDKRARHVLGLPRKRGYRATWGRLFLFDGGEEVLSDVIEPQSFARRDYAGFALGVIHQLIFINWLV